MRKGIAIPVGGTIMIVIMAVVLYVIHTGGWSDTAYVTYRGEIAMSAAHEVELTRKMLDQSSYFMAQRAAYNVAKNGGGSRIWNTVPTLNTVKNEIAREIEFMLPTGVMNASYPNREIKWGNSDIIIDPNGCNENCFYIEGEKVFELTDKNVDLKISSQVPFDQNIDSNFFELYDVATEMFNDPSIDFASLDAAGTYDGFKFEKTIDGNNADIVLYDDSCISGCLWEPYCIAPVEDTESQITLCGDALPFDYIKFEFRVPLSTVV